MSDGVIGREFESLPAVIRVRMPDKRGDGMVRSARVYNYIPEPECETDETGLPTRVRLDGFWYALEETCHNAAPEYLDFLCSECGFVHYHSDENDDGDGNDWGYCPRCGRRVVNE